MVIKNRCVGITLLNLITPGRWDINMDSSPIFIHTTLREATEQQRREPHVIIVIGKKGRNLGEV